MHNISFYGIERLAGNMTKYRVIQWGAGVNGSAIIRAVARHHDLEVVGCRVWSADKAGVDAGVLVWTGVPRDPDQIELVERSR